MLLILFFEFNFELGQLYRAKNLWRNFILKRLIWIFFSDPLFYLYIIIALFKKRGFDLQCASFAWILNKIQVVCVAQ